MLASTTLELFQKLRLLYILDNVQLFWSSTNIGLLMYCLRYLLLKPLLVAMLHALLTHVYLCTIMNTVHTISSCVTTTLSGVLCDIELIFAILLCVLEWLQLLYSLAPTSIDEGYSINDRIFWVVFVSLKITNISDKKPLDDSFQIHRSYLWKCRRVGPYVRWNLPSVAS